MFRIARQLTYCTQMDHGVGAETVILKIKIIRCKGCTHMMMKSLLKIEGVDRISIDAGKGKLTISGTIDPHTLAKILRKIQKKFEHLLEPMHEPCCSIHQAMCAQHSHCCQPRNGGCTRTNGSFSMGYPWPGNIPSAPPVPEYYQTTTPPEMAYNHPIYNTLSDENPHGCIVL